MSSSRILLPALLLGLPLSGADAPKELPVQIIALDEQLKDAIDPESKAETLAEGFNWSEGPVWVNSKEVKGGGYLLFSDVPENTVFRWEEGVAGVNPYLKPSGYTGPLNEAYSRESGSNGLALDPSGNLISCEHGDRRISVLNLAQGGKRTLSDNFEGKRFNSPNDACAASDGQVYFTDPPYGLPGGAESKLRELPWFGVYQIKDGQTYLVEGDLVRPNGIALSPDEKTLYVAQSEPKEAKIFAFDRAEDGSLSGKRVLFDFTPHLKEGPGLPDGLKVDEQGRIWTTAPGGVWVITAEGKPLGRIHTGVPTANCAFGGADGSTLFITADAHLLRIQTKTKGSGLRK